MKETSRIKVTMSKKQNEYFIEPGQSFEVDLFHPEDAEGVARPAILFCPIINLPAFKTMEAIQRNQGMTEYVQKN